MQKDPLLSARPHENLFSLLSAKARHSVASARGGVKFHVNAMMYMAPHKESGYGNVCTSALSCIDDCLWRSGQVLMGYMTAQKHERLKKLYAETGGTKEALVAALVARGTSPAKASVDAVEFIRRVKANWTPKQTVTDARIEKSRRWFQDREAFLEDVYYSIKSLLRGVAVWQRTPPKWLRSFGYSSGEPLVPVCRLNGTSDIEWERVHFKGRTFFDHFPSLQFYDYTKHSRRALGWAKDRGSWPRNYHLTFSMGGIDDAKIPEILAAGCNVTMVFDGMPPKRMSGPMQVTGARGQKTTFVLPETPVLYGDEDDLRFLDPPGHIVGLKYKRVAEGTKDPNFVLQVPGDVERWLKSDVGEREEREVRSNPDEADLLADAPAGSVPPIAIPAGQPAASASTGHEAVTRLGCGGYNYGKPLVDR